MCHFLPRHCNDGGETVQWCRDVVVQWCSGAGENVTYAYVYLCVLMCTYKKTYIHIQY